MVKLQKPVVAVHLCVGFYTYWLVCQKKFFLDVITKHSLGFIVQFLDEKKNKKSLQILAKKKRPQKGARSTDLDEVSSEH